MKILHRSGYDKEMGGRETGQVHIRIVGDRLTAGPCPSEQEDMRRTFSGVWIPQERAIRSIRTVLPYMGCNVLETRDWTTRNFPSPHSRTRKLKEREKALTTKLCDVREILVVEKGICRSERAAV